MKPTRNFCANEGDNSVGLSGPDAIEKDIDQINAMFNPLSKHENGTNGGIGTENLQNDIIEERHLKDNSVTDRKIGDRTIRDHIDGINDTGYLTNLFSYLGKMIRIITGESSWRTTPIDNIRGLDSRIKSNDTDISNLQNKDTDLQNQINSNNTDITNLQNKDTSLQNQISSNDGDIVDINKTLDSHGSSINNLNINKANSIDVYTKSEVDNKKFASKNIQDGAIEVKHFNPSINKILPETVLSAKVVNIESKLDNQDKQEVAIKRGLNYIEVEQDTMLHTPKIEGGTLVNKFGKIHSIRSVVGATINVPNNTERYNTEVTKVNISNDREGYIGIKHKEGAINLTGGKYYLVGCSVKMISASGSGVIKVAVSHSEINHISFVKNADNSKTNEWQEIFCKCHTTQNDVVETIIGTCYSGGSYLECEFEVTKPRIYEIDKSVFDSIPIDFNNVSDIELLKNYPYVYVDSVQHLTNPYFIAKGENLLNLHDLKHNVNGANGTIEVKENNVILNATNQYFGYNTEINILPNTEYTLSVDEITYTSNKHNDPSIDGYSCGISISCINASGTETYTSELFGISNQITFTTKKDCIKISILFYNRDHESVNNIVFKKPRLNIGSIAKSFKKHKISHQYFPIKLPEGDYVYKNEQGKFVQHKEWGIADFYNVDWKTHATLTNNRVGYKVVYFLLPDNFPNALSKTNNQYAYIIEKYDGKILKRDDSIIDRDSMNDIDSYRGGTDTSGLWFAISNLDTGFGQNYNASGSEWKAYFLGHRMAHLNNTNIPYTDEGVATYGSKVWVPIRGFNGSNGTNVLPTKISDVALQNGWQPYQLHYKLAKSEEINIHNLVEGSISLEEGVNQVEYGEGLIVREKMINFHNDGTCYQYNRKSNLSGVFKYIPSKFLNIFKGTIDDTDKWQYGYANDSNWYDMWLQTPKENFDTTSNYYCNYIMKNNYPISSSINAQIDGNIKEVVDSLVEGISHNTTDISVLKHETSSLNDDINTLEDKIEDKKLDKIGGIFITDENNITPNMLNYLCYKISDDNFAGMGSNASGETIFTVGTGGPHRASLKISNNNAFIDGKKVWHEGNDSKFIYGENGSGTLNLTDSNPNDVKKSGFYYARLKINETDVNTNDGHLIHAQYTHNNETSLQLFSPYNVNELHMRFRATTGFPWSPFTKILTEDDFKIKWFNASPINGNFMSGSRPIQYCKDKSGFVHIRGVGDFRNSQIAFILPEGYRPAFTSIFPVNDNHIVTIESGGNVYCNYSNASGYNVYFHITLHTTY